MNNYKLIEDRPELTSSQVVAGMNFTAVKAGAIAMSAGALGGKAVGAGLITKGLVAVLAVTGGLAVYKNYDTYKDEYSARTQVSENQTVIQRDRSKGPVLMMETIPPKNEISNSQIVPDAACRKEHDGQDESGPNTTFNGPYIPLVNIDSLNALEEQSTEVAPPTNTLALNPGLTCRKAGDEKSGAELLVGPKEPISDLKLSENAEAKLWKPVSLCDPTGLKPSQVKMDCDMCDIEYTLCSYFDNKGFSVVRLRVTAPSKRSFDVKSQFKNIKLIRDNSQGVNPTAVAFGEPSDGRGKGAFLKDNFKAKRMSIVFLGYVDIYLLFKDVRPGDKIVIDDFVTAQVSE